MQVERCIPEGSYYYQSTKLPSLSPTPHRSSFANRNVRSIVQEREKDRIIQQPPPILLSNTTPSFHPSTVYHITQSIEAHAPQAAVDPSFDSNTAGEESSPDDTNSGTPARPALKP